MYSRVLGGWVNTTKGVNRSNIWREAILQYTTPKMAEEFAPSSEGHIKIDRLLSWINFIKKHSTSDTAWLSYQNGQCGYWWGHGSFHGVHAYNKTPKSHTSMVQILCQWGRPAIPRSRRQGGSHRHNFFCPTTIYLKTDWKMLHMGIFCRLSSPK